MLNEIWITVFTLIKSIVGDVDVKNKGTLQKQIDDCFQSASDGKSAIASAITGKGVSTDADATFAQMAANIGSIKTNPRLQAKNAALSTAAQAIKPDSGYDGLSQVAIPAVTGNAAQGDVLSGRTFNSATAGIAKAGTLADKTGTADYSAAASLDSTNGRIKLQVPAVGKYGTGNYLYAAFATIASLIGLTASKLVKGCTILGITGNSANVDTSAGNAAASQILSGKESYVGGNLVTGSMSDKSGTTVTAGSVTQDSSYTYFGVPSSGYYSTGSKLRALNSNICSCGTTRGNGSSRQKILNRRPKYFAVMSVNDSSSGYRSIEFYNADFSTTKYYSGNNKDGSCTFKTMSSSSLLEITDDGVYYNGRPSSYNTYWIAGF